MSFQENLRHYREQAGFTTAKDFSKAIGISYSAYIGYEYKGREPKYETLCKIADTLHVSIDELLGHELNPRLKLEKYIQLVKGLGFLVEMDDSTINVKYPVDDDGTFPPDEVTFTEQKFLAWVKRSLAKFDNDTTQIKAAVFYKEFRWEEVLLDFKVIPDNE